MSRHKEDAGPDVYRRVWHHLLPPSCDSWQEYVKGFFDDELPAHEYMLDMFAIGNALCQRLQFPYEDSCALQGMILSMYLANTSDDREIAFDKEFPPPQLEQHQKLREKLLELAIEADAIPQSEVDTRVRPKKGELPPGWK